MGERKLSAKGFILFSILILLTFSFGWDIQKADCKSRVVVAQGGEPTRLDPDMHRDAISNNGCRQVYDALLERDQNGKIVPNLAESWRYVNETVLEFKLRKGINFSNGEPFNAEVVKYNFERVSGMLPEAKKTLNAIDFSLIQEIKIIDAYTVQIILKKPSLLMPSFVSQKLIVPLKYTKEDNFERLSTKPIGTGPYVLKSWTKGSELVFEAKKDYWKGAPKIDEVVFRPIPEDRTRIAELIVGNVDIIANLKPDNIEEVKAQKNLDVKFVPSTRTAFVIINTEIEKMKDVRIRKAINYALDVPSLMKNVMGGNAYRVSTLCPKNFVGWDSEEKFYPYDPEMAKKLLAEAGFPNGMDLTILTPRGRFLNDVQTCEAIAGMLTKVGIRTKVNAVEVGLFFRQTAAHQLQEELLYAAWGNYHFDILNTLQAIAKSGQMFSWYSNKKVDDYIDDAAKTGDPAKYAEYLRLALREIWNDAGFGFLYNLRDVYGVNKRVVWEPRPDEIINLYGAYVK